MRPLSMTLPSVTAYQIAAIRSEERTVFHRRPVHFHRVDHGQMSRSARNWLLVIVAVVLWITSSQHVVIDERPASQACMSSAHASNCLIGMDLLTTDIHGHYDFLCLSVDWCRREGDAVTVYQTTITLVKLA